MRLYGLILVERGAGTKPFEAELMASLPSCAEELAK